MGNDIVMIKMRVYYNYNRMDLSRMMLDNLMGRDRNLPKNSIHNRDHYSNSDVRHPLYRSVSLFLFAFVSILSSPTLSTTRDLAINAMILT